jgi:small conductance mechanosensitive channel
MERFEHFFESDFLQPGKPLGAIFYAFIFFVVAFYVTRMTRIFFQKLIQREGVYDRTVLQFLSQLVKVCIYLLALVFYVHLIPQLDHLGTALLASVSIVSVVIGFAAQPTLGNMVSGIALLLYRPFSVGDKLEIMAPTGLEIAVVERLTLGYTLLRTADNRSIIVPNSAMAAQVVINLTDKIEPTPK